MSSIQQYMSYRYYVCLIPLMEKLCFSYRKYLFLPEKQSVSANKTNKKHTIFQVVNFDYYAKRPFPNTNDV